MTTVADRLRLLLELGDKVEIDDERLEQVCRHLKKIDLESYKPLDWRDPKHFPGDDEGMPTVSQFFTIGNSINFRYWWRDNGRLKYAEGRKGGNSERGAFYMWRSLRVSMKTGVFPLLEAKRLAKIEPEDIRRIFRDDDGRDVMPALEERLHNWRDLGTKLHEFWGGEFYNLVKETRGSLFDFIQYSRQFRAFDDPLCKMIMVNAILHQGRGITKFDQPIFPGIDYELLKQQMRIGILKISKDLEIKIEHSELLASDEAAELRKAGLKAFLRMMEATSINGDILDNIWWSNRKACNTDVPICQTKDQESKCRFLDVCSKRTKLRIPLEITRYY